MRKVLLIACALVLMLGLSTYTEAQTRVLKGVVTAESDGFPMTGVTILDKGTKTGTTTNVDGEYSISVSASSVLVFSFIGYSAREYTVGNLTELNVSLADADNKLSEFVVTAFGMDKAQKSLGYATSVIEADDLVRVGINLTVI
jgi:hypothetical protein